MIPSSDMFMLSVLRTPWAKPAACQAATRDPVRTDTRSSRHRSTSDPARSVTAATAAAQLGPASLPPKLKHVARVAASTSSSSLSRTLVSPADSIAAPPSRGQSGRVPRAGHCPAVVRRAGQCRSGRRTAQPGSPCRECGRRRFHHLFAGAHTHKTTRDSLRGGGNTD